MERYSEAFYIIKTFFIHYVVLAGPAAIVAISAGAAVSLVFLFMIAVPSYRRRGKMLLLIALIPLFIGIAGSAQTCSSTREAELIEKKNGLSPSAKKYYDLEYAYSKWLLRVFPALIGAASSILPLILLSILRQKKE